jgi:plastocyanin
MTRLALALLAVLALVAAGCGGSSNSSSSSTSAPATNTPATSSAPSGSGSGGTAAGGGTKIDMKDIKFVPKTDTVKVGQKVTWTNRDGVQHNVTATSGAAFKSQNFGQGQTFSFTPTKAGTIKYVCTIHPGMTATLTVTK